MARYGETSSQRRSQRSPRRSPTSAAITNITSSTGMCSPNAEVPLFAQWDDHEVSNDWCPGEALGWSGYADKSVLKLAARGCRAFHEFMPMRETLAEAGRIYRKIPYGPLLDVFLLDMRSYRTPYGEDGAA